MHAPADSTALPADHTKATATLKTIFSVDFHLAGDGAPSENSVGLALSADRSVSRALAMHALKSALSRMRTRDKDSGQGPLEMLSASFVRAQAASAQAASARAASAQAASADATFVGFWMDMYVLLFC